LNLSSSSTLSHAASHLGTAQSLAVLLRALPFHAARRNLVIPADVASKHGVKYEHVFRFAVARAGGPAAQQEVGRQVKNDAEEESKALSGLSDAVYDLASTAHAHLHTARDMFKDEFGGKVPGVAMPAFMTGVGLFFFSVLTCGK
jgi:NADH dehydrogenase [ubiquinone] 1 alpha subcomplex assembly factor 6